MLTPSRLIENERHQVPDGNLRIFDIETEGGAIWKEEGEPTSLGLLLSRPLLRPTVTLHESQMVKGKLRNWLNMIERRKVSVPLCIFIRDL
jgi:hypothetical protein